MCLVLCGLGGGGASTVTYGGADADRDSTSGVPNGGYAISDAPQIYFWVITLWSDQPVRVSSVLNWPNPLMSGRETRPGYELIIPRTAGVSAEYIGIEGSASVRVTATGVSYLDEQYTRTPYTHFQTQVNESTNHDEPVTNDPNDANKLKTVYVIDVPADELRSGVFLRTRAKIAPTGRVRTFTFNGDSTSYQVPAGYPAYTTWAAAEPVQLEQTITAAAAPAEVGEGSTDDFILPAVIDLVNIVDPPPEFVVDEHGNRTPGERSQLNQSAWLMFISFFSSLFVGWGMGKYAQSAIIGLFGTSFFFMLSVGYVAIAIWGVSGYVVAPLILIICVIGLAAWLKS